MGLSGSSCFLAFWPEHPLPEGQGAGFSWRHWSGLPGGGGGPERPRCLPKGTEHAAGARPHLWRPRALLSWSFPSSSCVFHPQGRRLRVLGGFQAPPRLQLGSPLPPPRTQGLVPGGLEGQGSWGAPSSRLHPGFPLPLPPPRPPTLPLTMGEDWEGASKIIYTRTYKN